MAVRKSSGFLAVEKMLRNPEKLIKETWVDVLQILVGNSSRGAIGGNDLILQNLGRKWRGQRTFKPLAPGTRAQKTREGEQFMLVSSGTLKKAVQKKSKASVSGNKLRASAKVPDYGAIHQEGKGKMPQREFFAIRKNQEKLVAQIFEGVMALKMKRSGISVR